MANEGLITVRIGSAAAVPHLLWSEGMRVCLPRSIVDESECFREQGPQGSVVLRPPFANADWEAVHRLRTTAAFTQERPTSSRLPFSYQKVPPLIRSAVASVTGRLQRHRESRWAAFPMWPLDLSADFLADLVNGKPSPFIGLPTPVILSHDLDSPEGLENLVNRFLEIEEEAGARSANYIVPNGWPIRHDLLQEVKQRGHEIGIHGYDHANRTPFADATERRHRLESARELIDRYNIIGYRAPSLLRTPELLQDLSRYYRYDSSVPTSGGLFPVPNNGCASARPFLLEGIAELPLSLPRDGSLRFFGYAPAELTGIWVQCTERIARSGGVVVMLTHCENRFSGSACMLDAYRKFLGYIASSKQYEWSTPLRVLQNALGKSWVHRDGR